MSGRLQCFVRPFTRRYWIEKWDWTIYRFAHHSIRRMCERNGGFAYLFELWIRQWRKEHPIPRSIESATEHFFESTGGSREVVDEASWFRTPPEEDTSDCAPCQHCDSSLIGYHMPGCKLRDKMVDVVRKA